MGQILKKKTIFYIFFVFLLTSLFISGFLASGQDSETAEKGRKVFIEKRCYTCHTINAEAEAIQKEKEAFAKEKGVEITSKEGEERIGVDLSDIGKKRDQESLTSLLKNPKDFFKDTPDCKRNAKKKYRKRFKGTDEDLDILVTYLSGLKYDSYREKDFVSCLKEE